ncbi:MAG: hypothetical protein QNJ41_02890 [Xenococcaceae cyanobacterium MO_188.B32]|nr:hypothetical protein [Xenococcaceae cyanobacterium MO_188.B32]
MHLNTSTQTSGLEKALGISLAAFSMFVVGYTATRVYFNQPQSQVNNLTEESVIPHQASLWSELGRQF